MATIASLSVNLGMDTVAFDRGAGRAISSLKSIEKSSFATSVATGALAVGSAVSFLGEKAFQAGRAIASMVSQTIDSIDALKDAAQTAAITTDALGALQYAATLNGSSAEAVTNAIQVMNRQLGKAAADGGPVADALSRIGLSAQDLISMAPDQAFAAIAEGISQIENPMQRAAVAQDIFGKSSRNVLNVLALGKQGLADSAAEAARFGVALSQVDAEKVGAAKDALDRAGFAIEGIKNKIAIELAPFIELAANKFADLAAKVGGPVASAIVTGIEIIAKGVAQVVDILDVFDAGWLVIKATVLSVSSFVLDKVAAMGEGIAELINLIPGVEVAFSDSTRNMADALRTEMTAALDEMDAVMGRDRSAEVGQWFDGIRDAANAEAGAKANKIAADHAAGRSPDAVAQTSQAVLSDIAKRWQDSLNRATSKFQTGGNDKVAAVERRFISGFQGPTKDPQRELLKAINKQAKDAARTARATERIADQEPIEVTDI